MAEDVHTGLQLCHVLDYTMWKCVREDAMFNSSLNSVELFQRAF